ncbi:universal stress protein [Candidatus Bathyarchaeota archaeon]|nr:universal stress protein [Candidatus Bathyarchaeota archaeon]
MFKQVTAAIDGSPTSIAALETAAHIASQDKAELQIISIIEPLPIILAGTISDPINETHIETLNQYYKKLHHEQEHHLRQTYPGLKITTVIKTGRPAQKIQETAEDTDLIVIGHRGHSGIESLILGSVAKQILDLCSAPVLVVKTCRI